MDPITFPTLVFYDPRRQVEVPLAPNIYLDEEDACDHAALLLEERPYLTCMLVTVETGYCKHCNYPIIEKPGWILHKWMHVHTKAYVCQIPSLPKAEPKEGV